MLNREKFAKEIMDIAMKHSIVAVTEEGRLVKCGKDIGCDRCILSVFHNAEAKCDVAFGKWLNSEYTDFGIDWNRVPIDTPVFARNDEKDQFERRYFRGTESHNHLFITYPDGKTSWSGELLSEKWKFCELAREEDKQKYAKRGEFR